MLRFAGALLTVFLTAPLPKAGAQEEKPLPQADERYKADILVVVAHPDDEASATAYLARALDEHKRIAVVFGTRGSSGSNEAGAEQGAALSTTRLKHIVIVILAPMPWMPLGVVEVTLVTVVTAGLLMFSTALVALVCSVMVKPPPRVGRCLMAKSLVPNREPKVMN